MSRRKRYSHGDASFLQHDLGEFRWVNATGIEIVMDAESGMTPNTAFEHRHHSMPGTNTKPNDADYCMRLG